MDERARRGVIVTRTPLRISFAGGGTDLPEFYEREFGAVFSSAIDKFVYVTVKRHGDVFDEKIRLNYSASESVGRLDEIRNDIARECLKYLGVDPPIYISVVSDLPESSGLGGSGSFAVGLLHALHTYRGERVSAGQLAEEASYIEIKVLHQPIGKQDQYAAAFGGLHLYRFKSDGGVTVEPLRVRDGQVDDLFRSLLVLWTGHQRKSSSVLAEQRDRTGEHLDALVEMRRQAIELHEIVGNGQFDAGEFGRVLHQGWQLKRGLASTVTNGQIDRWYEQGIAAGAFGGKLCGAGGGGFLLFVADPSCHDKIRTALGDPVSVPMRHEAHGSRVLLGD